MPRRIVLVGKGESLHRAWQSRSFGLAGAELERLLHVAGFALDDTYHPVRVAGRLGPAAERPAARGFRYARSAAGRSTATPCARSSTTKRRCTACVGSAVRTSSAFSQTPPCRYSLPPIAAAALSARRTTWRAGSVCLPCARTA